MQRAQSTAQQLLSGSYYLLAVVFRVVILFPCGLYAPLIGWGQGRVIEFLEPWKPHLRDKERK